MNSKSIKYKVVRRGQGGWTDYLKKNRNKTSNEFFYHQIERKNKKPTSERDQIQKTSPKKQLKDKL